MASPYSSSQISVGSFASPFSQFKFYLWDENIPKHPPSDNDANERSNGGERPQDRFRYGDGHGSTFSYVASKMSGLQGYFSPLTPVIIQSPSEA